MVERTQLCERVGGDVIFAAARAGVGEVFFLAAAGKVVVIGGEDIFFTGGGGHLHVLDHPSQAVVGGDGAGETGRGGRGECCRIGEGSVGEGDGDKVMVLGEDRERQKEKVKRQKCPRITRIKADYADFVDKSKNAVHGRGQMVAIYSAGKGEDLAGGEVCFRAGLGRMIDER